MTKLQATWQDGKLVLTGTKDDDVFIAVNGREFVVACSLEQAEEFGGKIYLITHYDHNDETLPQSHFLKEV